MLGSHHTKLKQASATHQIKLSKLGKIKKHQNNSKTTQVNSKLLKIHTATGQFTQGVNFSTERLGRAAIGPSGAELDGEGETEQERCLYIKATRERLTWGDSVRHYASEE